MLVATSVHTRFAGATTPTGSSTPALLMKIARADLVGRAGRIEMPAAFHDHVDRARLFLQHTFDDQTLRGADRAAVLLVDLRLDDHVDQPRLILDGEEHEPLRRAGTLAGDHEAADLA